MSISILNSNFWSQDLSNLKYFYIVATYGGFSKGAKATGLSQPALSIGLKKLEDSLGTPLFLRRGKEIQLTAEGAQLLKFCQKLQTDFIANVSPGEKPGRPKRVIRLGSAISAGIRPLIPLMQKLQKNGIETHVSIESTFNLVRMLKNNEIDAALVPFGGNEPGVIHKKFSADPMILICNAETQPTIQEQPSGKVEVSVPLLSYPKDTPMGITIESYCLENNLEFPAETYVNSVDALISLVLKNSCVAFVRRSLVEEELQSGHFKIVETGLRPPKSQLELLTLKTIDTNLKSLILS